MIRSLVLLLIATTALVLCTSAPLAAQGVTTGAITGTINDQAGTPVANAQIQVVNRSTGVSTSVLSRSNGRYLVQGLEVGGPYSVIVTSIGFSTQEIPNLTVRLSEASRVDVPLSVQAVAIAGLDVTVSNSSSDFTPSRQGVSVTVSDTMIHRVPTFSRDFVDLVKLAPQVTFAGSGAASGAGAYNRYNAITIDGSNQSDRFNLSASGGAQGGAAGGKIISLDAVKEMKVMFTPTDVRQGSFAGMLVNAVTKSGTNQWQGGGLFTYRSNEDVIGLNLVGESLRTGAFSVKQYAFTLGGPIIRDRLHIFVAPEWQERSRPASGPYYTASGTAGESPAVPLDSLSRIRDIMSQRGFDVGSTEPISNANPLTNLFGRLDLRVNEKHRVVFRQMYNTADDDVFSRSTGTFNASPLVQNTGFRLSSNLYTNAVSTLSSTFQAYSTLGNMQNELIVGLNKTETGRNVPVQSPEIAVGVNVGGTTRAVTFGTEQFSPGNLLKQDVFEVIENLTVPKDDHTLTFGGRYDHTHIYNNFAQGAYGAFVFPTLTALANNAPTGYAVGYANSGKAEDIPADFSIDMYSLYAQDQWAVSDRLTITAGLRADIPRMLDKPPQNDTITNLLAAAGLPGLRTDATPATTALWSPRLGINFDPTSDRKNQIRAGVGIYTGPPPYIMLGNAYQNTGLGLVRLSCTGAATPAFTLDVNNLPKSCAGQPTLAPGTAGTVGINVNAPDFKYPQYWGFSAGFDRQLPGSTVLTVEGLYRKAINGVLIKDANFRGPRMVNGEPYRDRYGYVLYADTISATGAVTNNNQRYITSVRGTAFSEGIIQLANQSKDFNYSISGQLNKRFSSSLEATVAYTRMMSKDVQSLTSDRAISNWRNGRQLSEAHEDLVLSPSVFSRPERFLAYGTWTLPGGLTDITAYFERSSGLALTYVVNGDLNGDLYAGNEPIYVPNNALDPNEFRIGTGVGSAFVQNTAAAQGFENFIASQECLSEQRGHIMKRNSCRSPAQSRLDFSIRQAVPQIKGQTVSVQLDFFNFMNFLNKDWGAIKLPTLSSTFPDQRALTVVGRNPGPLSQSIPTFSFDNRLYQTDASKGTLGDPLPFESRTSSVYQIQLTVRYAF